MPFPPACRARFWELKSKQRRIKIECEEAPREVVKLRTKQRRTDHGSLATEQVRTFWVQLRVAIVT